MISPETIALCRESLESDMERLEGWLRNNPLLFSENEKAEKRGQDIDALLVKEKNHKASTALLEDCRAALKRMDDGTWGYCTKCGNLIEEDRQVARPEASRCKPCQEKVGLRVH